MHEFRAFRFAVKAVRAVAFMGAVALAGAGSSSFAGNATLEIVVVPVPNEVSLTRPSADQSQASTAYAAYRIDVTNKTGNTLNAVVFSSLASSNGTPVQFTEYVSQVGTCVGSGINLSCSIGQMKAGDSASVVAVFKAPTSGTSITFTTNATFSTQGSSSSTPALISYSPAPSGTVVTTLVDAASDPMVNAEALTYVPSTGTAVCTGANCIPAGTNPGTVTLKVPKTPAGNGTASLAFGLASSTNPVCSGYQCNEATVTAPGLYDNLTIVLRRNAAFIASGAKIEKSKVWYIFDNGTKVEITNNYCAKNPSTGASLPPVAPTGVDPATVSPCIAGLTAYAKNYKANPALSGVFEWVIYSLHNGRFDM